MSAEMASAYHTFSIPPLHRFPSQLGFSHIRSGIFLFTEELRKLPKVSSFK